MRRLVFMLVFLFAGFILGCQEEENIIIQEDPDGLRATSPISKLMSRVTQNNTSVDNVLDGTSVFRVILPVSITLNGQNLSVNSPADYTTIQQIKDQSNNDDDIVNFTFPITVSLRNFQQFVINSNSQLQSFVAQYEDLSELDCFGFNFPFSISTYDFNNQVADVITFSNNGQVISYLFSLPQGVIFTLNYPISVQTANGNTQNVNSNNQLLSLLEEAQATCGLSNPDEFVEVITSGSWRVSYFYDDDDETSNFVGYVFVFNSNNTITITKNGNTYIGTWSFYEDDGEFVFDIDFDDDTLDELTDDWVLLEFTNSLVQLKDDDNEEFLNFTRN